MKENNINLDAHSSLIIADGSFVEINGQKVLLTLVRDADAPETSEKGSELVGKWVRRLANSAPDCIYDTGKWYKIVEDKSDKRYPFGIAYNDEAYCTFDSELKYKRQGFLDCFDLSNPLDYNPETLIGKYLRGHEITSLEIHAITERPIFRTTEANGDYWVACKDITPSDVTDTPPLPSLKYEDCFERVKPQFWVDDYANIYECKDSTDLNNVPTERQAKQLAATIKLMTIAHDANGGWIPQEGERRYLASYNETDKQVIFILHATAINSPIYFRDYETAQRAYEANKEIFHDYFGINE